jgi:hypothetical protein
LIVDAMRPVKRKYMQFYLLSLTLVLLFNDKAYQ